MTESKKSDLKAIKYFGSRGRRKTAHAFVKMQKGIGDLLVNAKPPKENYLSAILDLVNQDRKWDIEAFVSGGGIKSQRSAIILATARALVKTDPELKTTLRKLGLLTRDPREKERKKPGLKRARRAPQWSKR